VQFPAKGVSLAMV